MAKRIKLARYGIPYGQKKSYGGILAGPSRDLDDATRKLYALFDHYGVARDDWPELARHLAADHVPDFMPRGRSGQRFDYAANAEILAAFDGAKSKRARATHLVKTDSRFKGKSAEYLRQREIEFRRLMKADTRQGRRLRKHYEIARLKKR
jgi:hypothetical protein